MKTIVIKECTDISIENTFTFDLSKITIAHCAGCWSCWWKTPGKCVWFAAPDSASLTFSVCLL